MSPLTIDPSIMWLELTELALGVPILTLDPQVIINESLPDAGAALKIMSLPLIANPSLG